MIIERNHFEKYLEQLFDLEVHLTCTNNALFYNQLLENFEKYLEQELGRLHSWLPGDPSKGSRNLKIRISTYFSGPAKNAVLLVQESRRDSKRFSFARLRIGVSPTVA